jgi:hypothetical protein
MNRLGFAADGVLDIRLSRGLRQFFFFLVCFIFVLVRRRLVVASQEQLEQEMRRPRDYGVQVDNGRRMQME